LSFYLSSCGTFLFMAQNGRFGLSLRVLAHLASEPGKMHTSAAIAAALKTSPVMVRRIFPALHNAGFIVQRKGPQGGAQLKAAAKSIGFGDIFAAIGGEWPSSGDKATDSVLQRARADAVTAMNDTTIAALIKKMKKSPNDQR
jgi:DNA-binding IscR family transcriptional regulator